MRSSPRRIRRLCIAGLGLLLPLQLLALATTGRGGDASASVERPVPARSAPTWPLPAELAAPATTTTTAPPLVTEPEVVPTAAPRPAPPPEATFAERYPAQVAATQDAAEPATTRWALLVGINEHRGGVSDNIGSRQDAQDLRAHLLSIGWHDDHIVLLTDRDATRTNILAGLAWLAEKTDGDSVAVLHYSGHSKKWYGQDHDGDGEVTDEGLWPTDGRYIPDSELVAALRPLDAGATWINFATCNAAGFADHGLVRPGRVLTFSSGEPQKSYEHPSWRNSVWGRFLVDQAMAGGHADADADGSVSVEEAFWWARPRASGTTMNQSHGAQDAVIEDHVAGELQLTIPGAPAAAAGRASERAHGPPAASEKPTRAAPREEPPRRTTEHHGNRLCVLCG